MARGVAGSAMSWQEMYARQRAYYFANLEKVKARQARWRNANREAKNLACRCGISIYQARKILAGRVMRSAQGRHAPSP